MRFFILQGTNENSEGLYSAPQLYHPLSTFLFYSTKQQLNNNSTQHPKVFTDLVEPQHLISLISSYPPIVRFLCAGGHDDNLDSMPKAEEIGGSSHIAHYIDVLFDGAPVLVILQNMFVPSSDQLSFHKTPMQNKQQYWI